MARKRETREIVIERNLIEMFLMKVKDFVRNNRKFILYSFVTLLLLVVVVIAAFIYYGFSRDADQVVFEKIMREYKVYTERPDPSQAEKIVGDLKNFTSSSRFGFAQDMSYYVLGNLLFEQKKFDEAKTNLLEFVDQSSPNIFAEMALLKAAVAFEELGKIDDALDIFRKFEEKHPESVILEQVYYYIGGIYEKKKDLENARTYYNKIISVNPQSTFAAMAKKKILLLGYTEK